MRALRDVFAACLMARAEADERLVVIDCDTGDHCRLRQFADHFPGRFVQAGISEQHALGMAAGYARQGFRPVVSSFAAFIGSRGYDQAKLAIGLAKLPVIVLGTHSGFAGAADGATHACFDDIGLFSMIPNFGVVTPADEEDISANLDRCLREDVPTYFRLGRQPVPDLPPSATPSRDCGLKIMRNDGNRAVISYGETSHLVVEAISRFAPESGISAFHVSRMAPFPDVFAYLAADVIPTFLCLEDHYDRAGLLAAVAQAAAGTGRAVDLRVSGIPFTFGETGCEDELRTAAGLDVLGIAKSIQKTFGL